MKVLYISHGTSLNGGERSFAESVKAFALTGHKVYAIFPDNGPIISKCESYLQHYEIISQIWWYNRNKNKLKIRAKLGTLKNIIKCAIKIYKYIKTLNPGVVITNTSVIPCGAIASKLAGKKHFWYLRELGEEDLGWNLIFGKSLSFWLINKLSSKVLFNSYFLESHYQKYISKKKRSVVYQAVELESISNESNEKQYETLKLIMTGRFAKNKGQLEAVKAVHYLSQQDEKVSLLLVGGGGDDYSNKIKNYIADNNLSQSVEIIDFTDNIAKYYAQSNIMLVCSRCEAFGRITIEAMKMGLPVIASNTGANSELVKDGFNGYIYQYGNPQDLAEKILLMKDLSVRNKISKQANKWADETFNIESYARDLNKIITE